METFNNTNYIEVGCILLVIIVVIAVAVVLTTSSRYRSNSEMMTDTKFYNKWHKKYKYYKHHKHHNDLKENEDVECECSCTEKPEPIIPEMPEIKIPQEIPCESGMVPGYSPDQDFNFSNMENLIKSDELLQKQLRDKEILIDEMFPNINKNMDMNQNMNLDNMNYVSDSQADNLTVCSDKISQVIEGMAKYEHENGKKMTSKQLKDLCVCVNDEHCLSKPSLTELQESYRPKRIIPSHYPDPMNSSGSYEYATAALI